MRSVWRLRPALLVVILAIVPGLSPAVADSHADVRIHADVELDQIVPFLDVVVPPSADGGPVPLADGEVPCERSMVVRIPASAQFQFSEREYESGCASVRYPLDLPAGLVRLQIVFEADRNVVRAEAAGVGPAGRLIQSLQIWDPADRQEAGFQPRDSPTEPLHAWDVFASDDGTAPSTAFAFDVEMEGPRPLTIEWWFQDAGARQPDGQTAAAVPQSLSATVSDVRIRMSDVALRTSAPVETARKAIGTDVQATFERALVVDDALYAATTNGTVTIEVEIPDRETFQGFLAPDGSAVAAASENAPADGGIIVLGSDAIFEAGPGTYRLVTTRSQPQEVAAVALIWALPLLVLPGLVGGRTLIMSRHWHAPGLPSARAYRQARLAAIAGLVAWGGVLATMASLGHVASVAGLPLGATGIAYLAILAFLTAALLLAHQHGAHTRVSALQSSEVALQKRVEDLRTFLDGVTHDLKTPIIALQWLTKDLQADLRNAGQDAAARQSLERITSNIGGMKTLVGDLLALARLEEGESQEGSTSDVVAVCAAVDAMVRDEAERRGARIEWESRPLTWPMSDARLRLILQNLVGNAIKYGRENGRVHVTARSENHRAILEVADDGPGIPDSDKPRIMGMFQRGADVAARGIEGTGLGLAIVAKVVEAAGGAVDVLDAPGGGALFRVTLPEAA